MEASTVVEQEKGDGAPVEQGAEATRTAANLFQYSMYVHAGVGAEECEHREDGRCTDEGHFHAWVCLPNSLQHHDIEEKGRAAQARRKRSMRDEGKDGGQPSDAYVVLESELDDLIAAPREPVLEGIADREQRKRLDEIIRDVAKDEEFEHYAQDAEEYRRLSEVPEDQRDTEEYEALDKRMTEFGKAVDERVQAERESELNALRQLSDEAVREKLRTNRIDAEARAAYTYTYYQWLSFIGTRKPAAHHVRTFASLQDLRDCSPEALDVIDNAVRDLEIRFVRGGAAGNS